MIAAPAESYSADGSGSEGDPSNLNRARWGEDVDASNLGSRTRFTNDLLNSEPQINGKILGVILNKTDMNELAKYSDFGGAEHYRHRFEKYYVENAGTYRRTEAA